MTNPSLNYNIALPCDIKEILQQDWWAFNNVTASLLRSVKEAIKFTTSVSIFVSRGSADIDINLLNVKVTAPCLVIIKPEEVVQLKFISDDFDASFVVVSERCRDTMLRSIHDAGLTTGIRLDPVVPVEPQDIDEFTRFHKNLLALQQDNKNPYSSLAFHHYALSFLFRVAYKCFKNVNKVGDSEQIPFRHHLVDQFLQSVQRNFKEQRSIEFYANILGVTAKHLSRTLKTHTGYTARDWVKNYLILEAKVMLKSSTLSMGEIAARLNFPSQSFFAKFFKNETGFTPKQYRNQPE